MLEKEILQVVLNGDADLLKEYVYEVETSQLEMHDFPEHTFDFLIQTMHQPEFLRLQGAWHLIKIFYFEWEKLSEDQKTRLFQALVELYGNFSDPMTCFYITEFLGQHFCEARTVNVLSQLRISCDDMPRSFLAHGLEHLVGSCQDYHLANQALGELLLMRSDKSDEVRYEVAESLFRLTKSAPDYFAKEALAALTIMRTDNSADVRRIADAAFSSKAS